MSASFFIAKRYLLAKRKGLFSMITTVIGVAGVTLAVAALIITLAVMNGFQTDIKQKVIDAQAHVTIYGRFDNQELHDFHEEMLKDSLVEAAAPFVLGQAILTSHGRTAGVAVKGFSVKHERTVNSLDKSLTQGSWENFNDEPKEGEYPSIVLGEELAKNLDIWVGDDVVLVSPQSAASTMGVLPKMKKFRIGGLIKTGYYEFDNTMAYCPIDVAEDFFGYTGAVTGLGLKMKNIDDSPKEADILRNTLGLGKVVKTYEDMNRNLFAALRLEKFVMGLILSIIILVATFNIASNLLMMSVEKLRDIGILRSMGASPAIIRGIFLWEGNMIALSGIAIGLVLGIGISWFVGTYPVIQLPSDIYYITKVPVDIRLSDIIMTAAVSYALCMASTVYPAIRASRISPMDAIRYG